MNTQTLNAEGTDPIANHRVVSLDDWMEARKALLLKEKELTRQLDRLAAERRSLPWHKVKENYLFDGPDGKVTLSDLFDGRSQLIVYHFMFGPDWPEGCEGCSFFADHVESAFLHLNHHDVSFAAVSRATVPKIEAFRQRMGWKFPWVSSAENDFNFDHQASFTREEMESGKVFFNYGLIDASIEELPGASVFYKDADGAVFHTYSTYSRGLERMVNAFNFLDITPKGRNENDNLAEWVRHHDRYDNEKVAADACCSSKA